MIPMIRTIHFEQTPEHLKVVLPVKRRWPGMILFTIMLIIWIVGLVWGVVFTFSDIAFSGQRFAFIFTLMLLTWLYIWYRLGKVVWKQWQYYTANREIMFINKERLIIRRPVSILGLTDAYDMNHISPFYYSEEHHCPSFDYGHQRIDFGLDLAESEAKSLIKALNDLYFKYSDDDDDDL